MFGTKKETTESWVLLNPFFVPHSCFGDNLGTILLGIRVTHVFGQVDRFRTAVPFPGRSTQNSTGLSPIRNCSLSKGGN